MWGFGCIVYELVKFTLRDNSMSIKEFNKDHRYLFTGNVCYPLSGEKKYS